MGGEGGEGGGSKNASQNHLQVGGWGMEGGVGPGRAGGGSGPSPGLSRAGRCHPSFSCRQTSR